MDPKQIQILYESLQLDALKNYCQIEIEKKEREAGRQYVIQVICGTTNREAAVELRKALDDARQPHYNKNDLTYSGIYYKGRKNYIQIK